MKAYSPDVDYVNYGGVETVGAVMRPGEDGNWVLKKEAQEQLKALSIKYSDLALKNEKLENELKDFGHRYNELILAVGNKHKDESRHETVLRYIHDCECSCEAAGQ